MLPCWQGQRGYPQSSSGDRMPKFFCWDHIYTSHSAYVQGAGAEKPLTLSFCFFWIPGSGREGAWNEHWLYTRMKKHQLTATAVCRHKVHGHFWAFKLNWWRKRSIYDWKYIVCKSPQSCFLNPHIKSPNQNHLHRLKGYLILPALMSNSTSTSGKEGTTEFSCQIFIERSLSES